MLSTRLHSPPLELIHITFLKLYEHLLETLSFSLPLALDIHHSTFWSYGFDYLKTKKNSHKWNHAVLVSLWLAYDMSQITDFSILKLNIISLYIHVLSSTIHLLKGNQLFHAWVIVNSVSMNMRAKYLYCKSFQYTTQNAIAGSHANSIFMFLGTFRQFATVFVPFCVSSTTQKWSVATTPNKWNGIKQSSICLKRKQSANQKKNLQNSNHTPGERMPSKV